MKQGLCSNGTTSGAVDNTHGYNELLLGEGIPYPR